MSVPEKPSPAPPPRTAAIAAVLAPVPLIPVPTAPQWIDVSARVVDPKSLY